MLEPARRLPIDAVVGLLILLCFAPVIYKYGPASQPAWDEVYFFGRALCVDRALLSADAKGFVECFHDVKRSPLLTLLAAPWGKLAASERGLGLVSVSLGILNWGLAIGIVLLLRAIRVPLALALTAALILPLTPLRMFAGLMYADLTFALAVALTLLVVPLEARTDASDPSRRADVLRGVVWGIVFSLGLLGKMTYVVFVAFVGPTVLALRWRARGGRSALRALCAAAVTSIPAFALTALSWRPLYEHAKYAAFGSIAAYYSSGKESLHYLASTLSDAPVFTCAMAVLVVALAMALRLRRRAAFASIPGIAALCVYVAIAVLSSNHDPRMMMPVWVGFPFALVVPWARLDERGDSALARHVPLWALVGVLLSVPMFGRYDFSNLVDQARLVRALPSTSHKTVLLLATDSPTLSTDTLHTALELVPEKKHRVGIDQVVYDVSDGRDVTFSLGKIARADYVILQSDDSRLWPEWTNRHVPTFRRVARADGRLVPALSSKDFEVYAMRPERQEANLR